MIKSITLYYNNTRENAKNTKYPYMATINTLDDFKKVVAFDHTSAEFKDNYRKISNFIKSDCTMLDVDNSESEKPEEWIFPKDIENVFPDVPFYVSYSRNHMKYKGDKIPRPKFHVYFPDITFTDSVECNKYKEKVCRYFPKFDLNAKDCARFFYGVESPTVEYHEGSVLLHDFMQNVKLNDKGEFEHKKYEIIPEGQRNNTLYRAALCFLTRYGADDNNTYSLYSKESEKCSPPLEQKEVLTIWNSALKFYNTTISKKPDYIPPKSFNSNKPQIEWELPLTDKKSMDTLLSLSKSRKKVTLENIRLIIKAFGISLRKNEMNRVIEISGLPDRFLEEDAFKNLQTIVEDTACKIPLSRNTSNVVCDDLIFIASENHYHPVLKMLESKSWDGKDRLESIYKILRLKDDFHKTLVRKWAIQTIALLHNSKSNPISAQGVLVLQGAQGVGKTEFFRHLAIRNEFFKEGATIDMTNKDSLISATRVWICELGEIDSTTRKMQSALKAFLTSQIDRFREPYERKENNHLRRTSFCGTVNPKQFLHDETGNRRYWTIPVDNIDIKMIFSYPEEWYTQFWLQICEEYHKDPKGYLLTPEESAEVNKANETFETSLYGEDEFLTIFDVEADKSLWQRKTAAEITEILNTHFKALRITASSFGKDLLPRLEKRLGIAFESKKSNGKLYKLCPPVRAKYRTDNSVHFNADDSENEFEELPDYTPEF